MRKELKYGFALLLAILVVPVCSQAQGQPTDKTITVFGQSIQYWDVGSGPVVVLLHGLGEPKEDWRAVSETLLQSFRVLVPDLIRFGGFHKPLIGYSIQI